MGFRRNYKDLLFCALFGSEERKGNALSLYNALAGTSYGDPACVTLTTIGDAVFFGAKNDASFIVGAELVLVEHQTTYCPNMPFRALHYYSRLYTRLAVEGSWNVYGERPLELPAPRYVVLYFGDAERPEREVMRLSDSFPAGARAADLEVAATVLNCTGGRNAAIMGRCPVLGEYARLVEGERAYRGAGMGYERAARAAVADAAAGGGPLAGYLRGNRAEVEDMLYTMEDDERAMRIYWENREREAREQALEQGLEQGLEGLAARLKAMGLDGAAIDEALAAERAAAAS